MEEIISLVIPFIALAFISVMIDKFTLFLEQLLHRIPNLRDEFEWYISYAIVLIISTLVCWQGDFRFFDYLNLYFPIYLDYFMTGLVISGGSAFVRTQFGMVESIPTTVMGLTSSFTRMVSIKRGKRDVLEEQNNKKNNNYSEEFYNNKNYIDEYADGYYPEAKEYYDDPRRYTDDI